MTASDPALPPSTDLLHRRLASLKAEELSLDRADAAVLILAREGSTGLEVLSEQRAERTGDPWSGHVGLPGGHTDPKDRSLTETVLRELQEEVGIPAGALEGTPRLFDLRSARPSGLRVAVFASQLADLSPSADPVDPSEVSTTFWLPLHALDHAESRPRSTVFGRVNVETVVFEDHVVWGFTLGVLRDFVSWLRSAEG